MARQKKPVHCVQMTEGKRNIIHTYKTSRKRKRGTECILCYECTKVCPTKALH